mmetsp:Transcript_21919/g.37114  ORF Transcript_21919/g.37114 Transcript_21919/m.37114 type:complete len:86 (-) Transcript_21919:45-302(-)
MAAAEKAQGQEKKRGVAKVSANTSSRLWRHFGPPKVCAPEETDGNGEAVCTTTVQLGTVSLLQRNEEGGRKPALQGGVVLPPGGR